MDQRTHNESFNRHLCEPQHLRTQAKDTAFASHSLLRDKPRARRASSSKQFVVTVSQELTASLGARFDGHRPARTTWFVRWIPSPIGHLQGACVALNRQILVTVSRALVPHQGREFDCAEATRMADEREFGLAAGQA